MEIGNNTEKKVLLQIVKDISRKHTITSISKDLNFSRTGIWKILNKLEKKEYIILDAVGSGKTGTSIIRINWENIVLEKAIALYLTEEAVRQRRWRINFGKLEKDCEFTILYGSILHSIKEANDIDVINIAKKNKFIKIQNTLDEIQKTAIKKIHIINFTENEFKNEINKQNKAFLDAIKKGVILFGQEKFVQFMKRLK